METQPDSTTVVFPYTFTQTYLMEQITQATAHNKEKFQKSSIEKRRQQILTNNYSLFVANMLNISLSEDISEGIEKDISLNLPQFYHVDNVYNLLGQQVATLAQNQYYEAGYHLINIDGHKWSSGVYFIRFNAGHHIFTRKMILIK